MSFTDLKKYKKDHRLQIMLSNMTRLKLERLSKEYGMSYSSIVEALINETFNHNNLEMQNAKPQNQDFDQTVG